MVKKGEIKSREKYEERGCGRQRSSDTNDVTIRKETLTI